MPKKIKDLAVKTGSYTDRQGVEKGRWQNVGSVLQLDDGGKVILLNRHFNPAGVPFKDGSDVVMISMFDPKDKDGNPIAADGAKKKAPVATSDGPDDDIPF